MLYESRCTFFLSPLQVHFLNIEIEIRDRDIWPFEKEKKYIITKRRGRHPPFINPVRPTSAPRRRGAGNFEFTELRSIDGPNIDEP